MSFNVDHFVKQRELLQKRFLAEKTGEQEQYIDQSRLLKPIIESQKKIIAQEVANTQTNNGMVPHLEELRKQNKILETSQNLPFHNIPIEFSMPKHPKQSEDMIVDVDQKLDTTDIENLQDLSFKLPSDVYKLGDHTTTLHK